MITIFDSEKEIKFHLFSDSILATEKGKNFIAYKDVKFWTDLDISNGETKPKHKIVRKFKKLMFESYE